MRKEIVILKASCYISMGENHTASCGFQGGQPRECWEGNLGRLPAGDCGVASLARSRGAVERSLIQLDRRKVLSKCMWNASF